MSSEFTYPGVYIKEIPSGPGPIAGVSTSNLGLIGFTTRGPVDEPVLVTSFSEFTDKFGTFTEKGLAPIMAYAFFQNSGQRLYMVRVCHDDASESSWDYEMDKTGEILGITTIPSGLYELQLDRMPVKATVPGSVIVTFPNAAIPGNTNVFRDDGLGAMVATGSGSGGTGSIDYVTGEITIQLAVPGEFTGAPNAITAAYTYRVLRFEMKWPGVVGDNFRVLLQPGSDDFMVAAQARWTRFTAVVQEDLNANPLSRAWSTLETFADVVLDDPTSKNYIVLVMNDTINGSQYVRVVDYGNETNPPELAGTAVTGEDLSTMQQHSDGSGTVPDAYDGAWKGWKYILANEVFPTTLMAQFQFVEGNPSSPGGALALKIGIGPAPASAVPILTWQQAAVDANSVHITCTLTGAGATTLTDDGAGHLVSGATQVGTVIYTTGAITIDVTPLADTFVANSALYLDCVYAQPVTVGDDGQGNAYIVDPASLTPPLVGVPVKFQLNASGTNTIAYDDGELILTWKIDGNPAAGPCGVATSPTAATKTGAIGPYSLTSGATFSVDVNNAGVVAVAFTATGATRAGGAVFPISATAGGENFTAIINGVSHLITASAGLTDALEIANLINGVITGGSAIVTGGGTGVSIKSDQLGTGSSVQIVAGSPNLATLIGHTAGTTAGTGNVADITSVLNTEVKAAVELATTADVTANIDGSFTISSPTAGVASELDFTVGLSALGIIVETINGTAGFGGGQTADYYTNPQSNVVGLLTGGSDGSATDSDDVVSPLLAADMRALYSFGKVDELMQLVAADFQTDTYVMDALLTYAELMKDKFVLGAVPYGMEYQAAVTWKRFTLNRYSSFGALYYPHIKIRDPLTGTNVDVPPGGHIAGVYARTDATKNVGKAPAGMEDGVLAWSTGLEYTLTPTQVGVLTENKINCLVQWPHTGRVVWGARSLDVSGGEWPYLQMRRLFMFVEKSVFRSTHVHVFKNNGPQLWNEISTQLVTFLTGLQQGGYFAGNSPSESFFVVCNRSNNPQNTVDQGIVYCDVGIAANKPCEFICFRFSQKSVS
jgi:phage tail sheath protein FI